MSNLADLRTLPDKSPEQIGQAFKKSYQEGQPLVPLNKPSIIFTQNILNTVRTGLTPLDLAQFLSSRWKKGIYINPLDDLIRWRTQKDENLITTPDTKGSTQYPLYLLPNGSTASLYYYKGPGEISFSGADLNSQDACIREALS